MPARTAENTGRYGLGTKSARDGSMNVPNISQSPGSATPLSWAGTGSEPVAPPRTDVAEPAHVRPDAPAPGISLTRLACFDINGDGHIDPRSAGTGGDATLLVPTQQVDLPTWSYTVNPMAGARVAKAKEPKPDATPVAPTPGNAAQTNRAVGAYQRYGQPPSAPGPQAALAATVTDATPAAASNPVIPLPSVTSTAPPNNAASPVSNPAVAAA
jgi:hypothetical protein